MANAYSRARQYGGFLQPINVGVVAQVMQTKQQQYDTNYLLIQSTMDRVANLDLIRPVDAEYLQDRLNQVNTIISQAGSLDLANNAVTTSLIKGINSAIDGNVMNAYSGTKLRRKELEEVDALRKKNPEKYNILNYAAYNEKFDEWYNNPEVGAVYSGSNYVPYVDVDKEIQELMVKASSFLKKKVTETTPVVGQDGVPYLQTKTKTIIDPERARMLIQGKLNTLQPQLEINARFGTNPEAIAQNYQSLMTKRADDARSDLAFYQAMQRTVGADTEQGKELQQSIDNITRNLGMYTEESKRGYTEAAGTNMYRMYLEDSFVAAYSGTLVEENKLSPNTGMLAIMRLEHDREQANKVNALPEVGVLPDTSVDTDTTHKGERLPAEIETKISNLEGDLDSLLARDLENLRDQLLDEGEFESRTGLDRNTNFAKLTPEEKDRVITIVKADGSNFSPEVVKAVVELETSREAYKSYRQAPIDAAEVIVSDLIEAVYQGVDGTGREGNTIHTDFTLQDPLTNKRIAIGSYIPDRSTAQEGSGVKILRNGKEEELTKEEYAKASVAVQFAKHYAGAYRVGWSVGQQDDFEAMMNYAAQVFSGVAPEDYLEVKAAAKKAKEYFGPTVWNSYAEHEGIWNKFRESLRRPVAHDIYSSEGRALATYHGLKELADMYGGNGEGFLNLIESETSKGLETAVGVRRDRAFKSWFSKKDRNVQEIRPAQDYTGEAASRDFRGGFARDAKEQAEFQHLSRVTTRETSRYQIPVPVGGKTGVDVQALSPLLEGQNVRDLPKVGSVIFRMEGSGSNPTLSMSWTTPATATRESQDNVITGITPQQIQGLGIPSTLKSTILGAMQTNTVLGINAIGKNRPNVATSLVDNSVRPQLREVINNKLGYNDLITQYSNEINQLVGVGTTAPLGVRLTEKSEGRESAMMFEYVLGDRAFGAEFVGGYLTEPAFDARMNANNSLASYISSLSQEQLVAILENIRNAQ